MNFYINQDPLRRTKPWGTLTTVEDPNTPSVIVLSEGQLRYLQDASGNLTKGSEDPTTRTTYDADGNPNGTEEIPSDDKTITDNTLFGSAAKDKIDGKTGNDQIDGGSGDDMIGGGAGSDNIKGGDGNDYISSSANIQNTRQQVSANDTWNRWGLPDGETAIHQGAMWGTYLSQQTPEFKVTVWSGITETSTDASDTQGDVIDGGAGNDWVMGSWAGDRIKGGDGQDNLDGLAGNDILEGGAGDDSIQADGIIKAGYLNSVDAANNGDDFADGGDGKDQITGGGGADDLFGGAGDDTLIGDSSGSSDSEFFVAMAYQGADYIDGEGGDDYIEGGGKDDVLYGGAGDDVLKGDTDASNLTDEELQDSANWGNDYLDGGIGADKLWGNAGDDALYGGSGDDQLVGNELGADLQGADEKSQKKCFKRRHKRYEYRSWLWKLFVRSTHECHKKLRCHPQTRIERRGDHFQSTEVAP